MKMPPAVDKVTKQVVAGDSTVNGESDLPKGHVAEGDVSGESPAQLASDVERIKRENPAAPDSSGQTLFAVINIIAGILLFCIGGVISLIFSIIAAVHISKANKATSREDAEDAIGVAKMMNIVAASVMALCLAACIIFVVIMFSN